MSNGKAKAIASLINGGVICKFDEQSSEYCEECPHKNTCDKRQSKDEEKTLDLQTVVDALNEVSVAIKIAFDKAEQAFKNLFKSLATISNYILAAVGKNKRVAFLAINAKKERTRKKNLNRIKKEILKISRNNNAPKREYLIK